MTWLTRYRIRHYCQNSLWILPVLGMLTALLVSKSLVVLDETLRIKSNLTPESTRSLLEMMASSLFSFIVFVCSALLIAVQLASSQLTPRIIGIVFREPVTKWSLTIFVFSFTFAQAVIVRIESRVPDLSARLAAYCCVANLAIFLFLIDHVGKWLRPSGALRAVAMLGRGVIESVYPRKFSETVGTCEESRGAPSGRLAQTVRSSQSGVVLAFDFHGLVSMAERADAVIEMAPQVGDYVTKGDPLFLVYDCREAIVEKPLQHSIAVGQERTIQQDPALAFRMIVDIAAKALSAAINDPTTAVLAIDQVHHLLRNVGGRSLADERVRGKDGKIRLVYRTPDWEDFVTLAVTEIRHYGGGSIQVSRRLRAMLKNLIQTLPAARSSALAKELGMLQRSAARFFAETEDRQLAEVSDSQGVGSSGSRDVNGSTHEEARPPVA